VLVLRPGEARAERARPFLPFAEIVHVLRVGGLGAEDLAGALRHVAELLALTLFLAALLLGRLALLLRLGLLLLAGFTLALLGLLEL
jgi:hypothetical protein